MPKPSRSERRQLTLLFCDLVGSTALSHRLDPEDLIEVVHRYQDCARAVIARYEGFVAQLLGDGILVYFGYPQAHEDDAARAIHAGLDIVDALRRMARDGDTHAPRLDVRIGIATGLVVVGDHVGQGISGQVEAMGETPNVVARLQDLAEPNGIVVAAQTRDLAGGAFEYEDGGWHDLKGVPHPTHVWRVLGPSTVDSRFEAAHPDRVSPLVGRAAQFDRLLQHWQRARSGEAQMVLMSGEAGIGKSRLAQALAEHVESEPHGLLRYQCSPFHTNSALYPIIRHLERAVDFRREDLPSQRLDKLQAWLQRVQPDAPASGALLAGLLSLPGDERFPPLQFSPQQRKERMLEWLIGHWRGLATRAPLLLIFEDFHWIDPTSAELLERLAQRALPVPLLALVTTRPLPQAPGFGGRLHALPVERLDASAARALAASLLERSDAPAEVADVVVARADGVPLFIEELAKALAFGAAAGGARDKRLPVPPTLHHSLMERLDRLGPAREVAQMASVIGREFSRDMLAVLSPLSESQLDAALDTLTASTVISARDVPSQSSYAFRHALLQDAAYASLLRSRRQELHGRVAASLEHQYPERARVEPELVAHHYTEAGARPAAARYWAAAAQRALERSANREALAHADKGLAQIDGMAPGSDRDRLELSLRILEGAAHRAVSGFASTDSERCFGQVLKLSQQLDDTARLIEARRGLFACHYARGALALAGEQGRHLAELGSRTEDRGSRMLGHWMLGCVRFWQGEFAAARHELQTAYSLYDPRALRTNALAQQIDPGVNALLHLSWTLWIAGYPDQAQRTGERAVATARELAQPFALAMALFWAASTLGCCGRYPAMRQLLDELLAVTAEQGLGYLGSCARVLDGQYLVAQGRAAEALLQVDRAFAEFRAQQAGVGLPWATSIAVTAHVALGQPEDGLAILGSAFEAAARNGERQWEAELWRLQGELALLRRPANAGEAERCFRAAMATAQRQAARSLELRAATSLARLLADRGDERAARELLGKVCAWFSEGADTADLRAARSALDALG